MHVIQGIPLVQHVDQRIHHLAQVVGWDIGGHTHCDAAGAIDQQVRCCGW